MVLTVIQMYNDVHVSFNILMEIETREKSRRDLDTMNYPTIKIPYRPIRKFNLNSIL